MMGSIEETIDTLVARRVREELSAFERRIVELVKPVQGGDYLTPGEAAKVASVHVDTVRLWLKSGKLPKHHAGGRMRIRREDLDRFLSSGPSGPEGGSPSAADIASVALGRRKGKLP